jgi:hypothetical protein
MPDFGIFRGFNDKLFGDRLYAGQLPTQLGLIGSENVSPLLLDLYPSAAAAYSLRKLRDAYTGSAIRVRRTDLQESDIGFTSTGELDTTALLAFTGTGALNNGFVTNWYDQSGNGRNATQTLAINQPQIVSSGSIILKNSKPTLNFNSSKDLLQTAIKDLPLSSFSFYQVLENPASDSIAAGLCFNGGASKDALVFYPYQSNVSRIFWRNIGGANGTTTPTGSAQTLYSFNYSRIGTNNSYTLHRNTTLSLSRTSTATSTGFDDLFIGSIGGDQYLNTNMQELILYPSDQSSNRTGIEDNINDFYSIY